MNHVIIRFSPVIGGLWVGICAAAAWGCSGASSSVSLAIDGDVPEQEVGPYIPIEDASSERGCPQQCPSGTTCQIDKCVANKSCKTDNDCDNDQYCAPEMQCMPWGSNEERNHDEKCVQLIAPGQFAPTVRCEFVKGPSGDPFADYSSVQATPLVVNFNKSPSSDPPSIVAPFYKWVINTSYTEAFGIIRVLRGSDCSQEAVIGGTDMNNDGKAEWVSSSATPALGDLDGDGVAEIVAFGGEGRLLAFTRKEGKWSLMWQALDGPNGNVYVDKTPKFSWGKDIIDYWGGLSIHDLDDDGKPEIIAEGVVFDVTGVLKAPAPEGFVSGLVGSTPVLANLDDDALIEFTDGSTFWSWKEGKWEKKGVFQSSPKASYSAVADFGAYGKGPATNPEVAIVSEGKVTVYAMDGSVAMPSVTVPGLGGGRPTIADYDGDGFVEVGVAGRDFYTVFDIDCTSKPRKNGTCAGKGLARCDTSLTQSGVCPKGILWSRKTQDHSSNKTGSSVFDFEADGKAEVVYADECFVRVYDGTSGEVLFSQYHSSCTWCENPIVADVDGNFRADLVVPSNLACGKDGAGIKCEGLLDGRIDPQFAGLRCEKETDCVSGVCDKGYCRCKSTSECCASKDNTKCLEMGYQCHTPPAALGGGKTCRAAHPHGVQGIRVYSDINDKWVRSRAIWNQHAYAVTHVNEDGTIPKTSQWKNNWQQDGLNNFRQNVPGTRNGTAIADPTVGAKAFDNCNGSSAILHVNVCNRGADSMGAGVVVGFYVDDSSVCKTQTQNALEPGQCEEVSCAWKTPPKDTSNKVDVAVRVNDDGALSECKDGNNTATIYGVSCEQIQ